jgi:hypothetical protein
MSYLDPELVAFWTARLGETEQIARAAAGPDGLNDQWDAEPYSDNDANLVIRGKGWLTGPGPGAIDRAPAFHAAHNDPAAVLRSVKADRAILAACLETLQSEDSHDYLTEGGSGEEYDLARFIVRQRASVYSTHPDYQEKRKP